MIVVSDTSPLRHLAALGLMELLPRLFSSPHCPTKVIAKCLHTSTPHQLRQWADHLPDWLLVMGHSEWNDPCLDEIDPGKASAIRLAHDLCANVLLMDDQQGRKAAQHLGFRVSGLIGILGDAASQGFVDFDALILQLKTENKFLISDALIESARPR